MSSRQRSSVTTSGTQALPKDVVLAHVLRCVLWPLFSTAMATSESLKSIQQHVQSPTTLATSGSMSSLQSARSATRSTAGSAASIADLEAASSSLPTPPSMSPSHPQRQSLRPDSMLKAFSRTLSSSQSSIASLYSLSNLAAPTLPLSPGKLPLAPPLDSLCSRIADIFGISQQDLGAQIHAILNLNEPDTLIRDLEACHLLLSADAGQLKCSDFDRTEDYEAWKTGELAALAKLVLLSTGHPPLHRYGHAYSSSRLSTGMAAAGPQLLIVNVIEAQGLLAKDKASGSSNPYCVVHCNGRTFVSPVLRQTVGPRWLFQVPMYVQHQQSGPSD
ncbi:hypothetical protein BC831DRAFT_293153 [Entophlyctis helioformis]|nr:hypothetical protein BC831DRAFT_293153 [Entophlyctis helioformis]